MLLDPLAVPHSGLLLHGRPDLLAHPDKRRNIEGAADEWQHPDVCRGEDDRGQVLHNRACADRQVKNCRQLAAVPCTTCTRRAWRSPLAFTSVFDSFLLHPSGLAVAVHCQQGPATLHQESSTSLRPRLALQALTSAMEAAAVPKVTQSALRTTSVTLPMPTALLARCHRLSLPAPFVTVSILFCSP